MLLCHSRNQCILWPLSAGGVRLAESVRRLIVATLRRLVEFDSTAVPGGCGTMCGLDCRVQNADANGRSHWAWQTFQPIHLMFASDTGASGSTCDSSF